MSRCWKSVLGYFGQLFISGQRAVKIVKPDHNDQLSWIYTYYIYDATGNVMATYTRRNYFDDIGDSSYAFVNDWIYNELGLTDLQDFMESKFNYNGQFMNDWIEYLSTNELAAGVFDEFSPDDFLGWDATLVPAVLSNFAHSPNASPTENDALLNAILSNQQSNFVSSVLNSGTAVLNNALTGILSNDPTDLLLNCMATNNPVGLNSVYVSLGGSPTPPPTNASRIAYIRSFPPPTIAAQISAIESISNLQNYFSSCLNTSMIYNSWNSAQPNISFIDLFDAWSGLGDTSLILDVLQNHYSNDAHLRILLKEVRTLQQLYQMASNSNYSTFVNQSINSTSYVDLSFVMYQSSALTFSSYLKMLRTHFGSTTYSSMMSDIGELLKFGKDITWQEQHIYGSSRLGMYQSGQLLVKYKYKYSDTLQIYLDSVKFDRNTARAMRRMSQKQYELTNHLGNVLSTVLDRKTPITATGGSGSSATITHYEGDVVFATDYYPFGSPMSWSTPDSSGGRMYSGAGYRYGFNGKEKDDEVMGEGNLQDYGFRMYTPKLGKFLSIDPLTRSYPYLTPFAFAENDVIRCIDLDGLEKLALSGFVPPEQYYKPNVNENSGRTHYTPLHISQFKKQTEFLKKNYGYNTILQVSSGQEVLFALMQETINAGEITHLSIFAHGGQGSFNNSEVKVAGLFFKRNAGFYTKTMSGSETGSIQQLGELIKSGDIKFAEDAKIFLNACNTAGVQGVKNSDNFAEQLCLTTGAVVFSCSGHMAQEVPGIANGKFKIPDGEMGYFFKYSRIEEEYEDKGLINIKYKIKKENIGRYVDVKKSNY